MTGAAVELAALLTRANGASLRVIGILTSDDDASRLIARVALAVQRVIGVPVEPVLAEPTAPSLLAALADTTPIIGMSGRWQSQGLGALRYQIAQATTGTTIIVRRGVRPGLLAPPTSATRFAWSITANDPA